MKDNPDTTTLNAILRKRAEQLSRAEKIQEEKPSYTMLKFLISGLEYGLEIPFIREVIFNSSGYTPIPGVPDYILGIKDIRGEIIPIVDILRILGIGQNDAEHRDFCIVAESEDIVFGIMADSIKNIDRIEKESVNADAASVSENVARFCYGLARDGSLLLNGNLLFTDTLIRGIER